MIAKSTFKTNFFFFLAILGLCYCVWTSSSCSEWGYSSLWFVGVSLWWLLLLQSMGSRVYGLQWLQHVGLMVLEHRLSSCLVATWHMEFSPARD